MEEKRKIGRINEIGLYKVSCFVRTEELWLIREAWAIADSSAEPLDQTLAEVLNEFGGRMPPLEYLAEKYGSHEANQLGVLHKQLIRARHQALNSDEAK